MSTHLLFSKGFPSDLNMQYNSGGMLRLLLNIVVWGSARLARLLPLPPVLWNRYWRVWEAEGGDESST